MRSIGSIIVGGLLHAGVLAAVSGTVGLAGSPSTASAQEVRMGGPRGFGGPEVSKRSIDQYAKILKLDAAQKEAAMHLQESYADATRRAGEEMQEAMKSIKEDASDGDFSGFGEKMPKIMEAMGKKRSAAQQSFLSDLKQLLTPAQEAAWPNLERFRRREAHLSGGMVSGSGVDLTTVVESLKLPDADAQKMNDTLTQYEQDMDRLLVDREKDDGKKSDSFDFDPANFDMEKMKARMDEARVQALKVRDLNKQYERRLSAMLADDARAKFEKEVKARSFRQIYREPHVSKMLNAAAKFDDLDPTQKKQIDEMKTQYEKDLSELNTKWAAALEQAETEGKAGGMPFMGGGKESDELKAAKTARKELDKKFSERVKTALNDKQKERLPKKDTGERTMHFADGGEGGVFVHAMEVDDGEGTQSNVEIIVAPGGG